MSAYCKGFSSLSLAVTPAYTRRYGGLDNPENRAEYEVVMEADSPACQEIRLTGGGTPDHQITTDQPAQESALTRIATPGTADQLTQRTPLPPQYQLAPNPPPGASTQRYRLLLSPTPASVYRTLNHPTPSLPAREQYPRSPVIARVSRCTRLYTRVSGCVVRGGRESCTRLYKDVARGLCAYPQPCGYGCPVSFPRPLAARRHGLTPAVRVTTHNVAGRCRRS